MSLETKHEFEHIVGDVLNGLIDNGIISAQEAS